MIKLNYDIYRETLHMEDIDDYKMIITLPDNSIVILESDKGMKETVLRKGDIELKLYYHVCPYNYFFSFWYYIPSLGNALVIQSSIYNSRGSETSVINMSIIVFDINGSPKKVYSYNTYNHGITTFEVVNSKLEVKVLKEIGFDRNELKFIICVNKFVLEEDGFKPTEQDAEIYLEDLEKKMLIKSPNYKNCEKLTQPYIYDKAVKN